MKRYVVFGGERAYAAGGALDYIVDFSSFQDAANYRTTLLQNRKGWWSHVWDTKTHSIYPDVEEDDFGFTGGIA